MLAMIHVSLLFTQEGDGVLCARKCFIYTGDIFSPVTFSISTMSQQITLDQKKNLWSH
jgi:hypothetical protein